MKHFLLLSFLFLLPAVPSRAQAGPYWEWAQQAGVTGADVALDFAGNAYVVGTFAGTVGTGTGNLVSRGGYDISLAKYDAQGRLLWIQQAGGAAFDYGRAVAVDVQGNVYITGSYSSATAQFGSIALAKRGYVGSHPNMFVAKYSPQGTALWAQGFSGPSSGDAEGTSLAVDSQGNVFAAGGFDSYLDLPNRPQIISPDGANSSCLIKLDTQGVVQWGRSAGHTGAALGNQSFVSVASSGLVYLAGATLMGPAIVNNAAVPLQSFLTCFTATGAVQWAHEFGSTDGARPTDVTVDSYGNAVVVGGFYGAMAVGSSTLGGKYTPSTYAINYNLQGTVNWATEFSNASAAGVTADGLGNWYLVGSHVAGAAFGSFSSAMPQGAAVELYIAKLTSLGQVEWVRLGGGDASSAGTAVAVGIAENVYVTGWGQGQKHCGAAAGSSGLVLARLHTSALTPTLAPLQPYPNPAPNASFDIVFPSAAAGPAELQLFSSQGRLVRTQSVLFGQGQTQLPFDRSSLPPGRYTLRFVQKSVVNTAALVLQ